MGSTVEKSSLIARERQVEVTTSNQQTNRVNQFWVHWMNNLLNDNVHQMRERVAPSSITNSATERNIPWKRGIPSYSSHLFFLLFCVSDKSINQKQFFSSFDETPYYRCWLSLRKQIKLYFCLWVLHNVKFRRERARAELKFTSFFFCFWPLNFLNNFKIICALNFR